MLKHSFKLNKKVQALILIMCIGALSGCSSMIEAFEGFDYSAYERGEYSTGPVSYDSGINDETYYPGTASGYYDYERESIGDSTDNRKTYSNHDGNRPSCKGTGSMGEDQCWNASQNKCICCSCR